MGGKTGGGGPLASARLYMVEVRATDWDRLCRFYGETLGLARRMVDPPGKFAMFGQAEPYIAVVGRGEVGPGRSRVVIDLVVEDLDAVLRVLSARGVVPEEGPTASPEGYRLARVADPEANEIHLFEWAAPRGA